MMRMSVIITTLESCALSSNLEAANVSFMEAIKATPLLDGKSLDGTDISASFEISAVTDKKQNVFELEDTLRSLAADGRSSINDPRAIGMFAQSFLAKLSS